MALFTALLPMLFSLLVLHLAHAVEPNAMVSESAAYLTPHDKPLLGMVDCEGACESRCSLSSRPKLCKRACETCCYRCSCVPPGTSGNLEACPC